MTQIALLTKWTFVVEFVDEETHEIAGTIGQSQTLAECEALIEHETQYHFVRGKMVFNAEAAEVCAECGGEGKVPAGNGGQTICDACGGHLGPISSVSFPSSYRASSNLWASNK